MANVPPIVVHTDPQISLDTAVEDAELGGHDEFHAPGTSAATGVVADGGIPAWFGPALAAGLAPVVARIGNIERNIEYRLGIIEARQVNSVAAVNSDVLRAIPNAAGIAAPNFPPNFLVLATMGTDEMHAFLAHYGLPMDHNDDTNLRRIKKSLEFAFHETLLCIVKRGWGD